MLKREVIKINKQEKTMPIMLGIVLFFFIIAFVYEIISYYNFEKQKESGNERWKQVEERIETIEECCNGRNS